MDKLSNKEILHAASFDIGERKRFFKSKRNKYGFHYVGEGIEVVNKTSKEVNGIKTILHTLADGRRVRYTVQVEKGEKIIGIVRQHGKVVGHIIG